MPRCPDLGCPSVGIYKWGSADNRDNQAECVDTQDTVHTNIDQCWCCVCLCPTLQTRIKLSPPEKDQSTPLLKKLALKTMHGYIPGLGVTAAPPMLVWIWSGGGLDPAAGGEHKTWYGSEYSEYAELLPCEYCWQQPARLFLIQLSVLPVICGGAGRCRSRTGQPTTQSQFGGNDDW